VYIQFLEEFTIHQSRIFWVAFMDLNQE
jgi:hypothetical protein